MDIVEKGHIYNTTTYDGPLGDTITFMKRIGEFYPGNAGAPHPGTNCQEVLRVLIDRVEYLNNQVFHTNNITILHNLRSSLWLLEQRAAERHGIKFDIPEDGIESRTTCEVCGHVVCENHL